MKQAAGRYLQTIDLFLLLTNEIGYSSSWHSVLTWNKEKKIIRYIITSTVNYANLDHVSNLSSLTPRSLIQNNYTI